MPDFLRTPTADALLPLVPIWLLICNLLLKKFVLNKGLDVAGSDLMLAGYSLLLVRSLNAFSARALVGDAAVFTVLSIAATPFLWFALLHWIKRVASSPWHVFYPNIVATYAVGCGFCWTC